MPTYDVHLYPIVRVKVEGVEAESYEEAIKKAEEQTNLHELLDCEKFEFAEEITHYLVDVQGDKEYEQMKWFHCDQDGNLKDGAGEPGSRGKKK